MPPSIRRSHGCCGVYEMFNLYNRNVKEDLPSSYATLFGQADDRLTEDSLEKYISRTSYYGKSAAIIVFYDADGGDFGPGHGEKLAKFIRSCGWSVNRFTLGTNPKTGNKLLMYHWHTRKGKVSKNVEYIKEPAKETEGTVAEATGGVVGGSGGRKRKTARRKAA